MSDAPGRRHPRSRPQRAGRWAAALAAAVAVASTAWLPDERFSSEVVSHLLVGMVAPVLVVVAGLPVATAHRVGPARVRRWSRTGAVRALTNPGWIAAAFVLTPWALWLTPLVGVTHQPVAHAVVHAHMLLVGVLFVEHLVGRAPLPVRWSWPARLLAGAVVIASHGFLGLALLAQDRPLMAHHGASPAALADQRLGAQLMWVGGEIVAVPLLVWCLWRWIAHEERRARLDDLVRDLERPEAVR
ncbi:cytochrome c oxidase assembly protein [Dermatobacter hominis]|uniref:cytochrome c oxidase assembly protein n=1 Tax=Dermatobacter hominis TaxID=2884263 RepID=UPI001D12B324|nr:cytochrome c oxidase assembly protein [Dermatobacter hominis]UDY34157.1 cytochrome c oxidase assembly protein [Dermatobacter hominis]